MQLLPKVRSKAIYEKLEQPEELPFLIKNIDLPTFDAPFHFHPELELTLILESRGLRYIGDHVGNFEPGDLLLLGKNLPHFWNNTIDSDESSKAIVLQFTEHFLGRSFFQRPGLNKLQEVLIDAQRGILIKGKDKVTISQKIKELKNQDPLDCILDLLSILNIISLSDDVVTLCSPDYTATLNQKDCDRMNSICNYVSTNYGEEIRIEYIASKVANMSVSAFCHYFRKRMNKTFTQFVNEIRIEEINRRLIETNDNITSIGYQCGFKSLSNFYKQFQRINGQSPKQFRKVHQL